MEATTQPTLKNSATAIWGFVLGTLGLLTCGLTSIPGLILSIIGTVKTKNPENGLKGHGMAVSGIVLSGVAMLAGPVIASIALPVFMQTGKYMERVEAQQTAVQLYGAMRNYFSEYKQMPDLKTVTTDANGDFQIESNSQELTKILTGENKRGIVFYQPSSQIIDPWGNPFQILFDGNLDGSLEVPSRSGSGTETIPNNIAVWSFGPNGVHGAGTDSRNDDVYAY